MTEYERGYEAGIDFVACGTQTERPDRHVVCPESPVCHFCKVAAEYDRGYKAAIHFIATGEAS